MVCKENLPVLMLPLSAFTRLWSMRTSCCDLHIPGGPGGRRFGRGSIFFAPSPLVPGRDAVERCAWDCGAGIRLLWSRSHARVPDAAPVASYASPAPAARFHAAAALAAAFAAGAPPVVSAGTATRRQVLRKVRMRCEHAMCLGVDVWRVWELIRRLV